MQVLERSDPVNVIWGIILTVISSIEIKLNGHISEGWAEWFEGSTLLSKINNRYNLTALTSITRLGSDK